MLHGIPHSDGQIMQYCHDQLPLLNSIIAQPSWPPMGITVRTRDRQSQKRTPGCGSSPAIPRNRLTPNGQIIGQIGAFLALLTIGPFRAERAITEFSFTPFGPVKSVRD